MTDERVARLGRRLRRLVVYQPLVASIVGVFGFVAVASCVRSRDLGSVGLLGCLAALGLGYLLCFRVFGILIRRCDAALVAAIRAASIPRAEVIVRK